MFLYEIKTSDGLTEFVAGTNCTAGASSLCITLKTGETKRWSNYHWISCETTRVKTDEEAFVEEALRIHDEEMFFDSKEF